VKGGITNTSMKDENEGTFPTATLRQAQHDKEQKASPIAVKQNN
jgi:hypothetical protein